MNKFDLFEGLYAGHKVLIKIILALFIVSVLLMSIFWILGLSPIIQWESSLVSELHPVPVTEIISYPFTLDFNLETVIFNEFMKGTPIKLSTLVSYVFLTFSWVSIIIFLSISTYLKKFWYYIASGLFMVIIVVIKPDLSIMIFNGNWMAAIMMIGFLSVSYYFHSFNKNVGLVARVISFTITAIFLALIIGIFSPLESPFLYLAAYGYPVAFIITIIAIFLVAHDIIAGLFNIVSSGIGQNPNNWKHFYIVSLIYLVNVALMYMNETGMIDWRLLEVSPVLFFLIAFIVGFKGFRDRENQYDYLFSFNPLGFLFYLSMGVMAFITIGYIISTGNDPALEVIEDFILYSQLGYGFIFLTYITANFIQPMTQGLPVYRILYKPDAMPYFTYRLAGLITFGALMFVVNWELPVYQSVSGYYNMLGDAHYLNDERTAAIGYYRKGGQYGYNNHRSNYALANISLEDDKFDDAIDYYTKAVTIRPSEFAFANLSNLYLNQKEYFNAVFTLQDGLEKFPESGPLMNNIGLLYARGNQYDSAIHYLNRAILQRKSSEVASNNIFNLLSKTNLDVSVDSMAFRNEDDWVNRVNRLAFMNINHRPAISTFVEPDSALNIITDAYLYNYMINTIWQKDSSNHKSIEILSEGFPFSERKTKLVAGLYKYFQGNIYDGLKLVRNSSFGEAAWTGTVYDILGKLYFQLGDEKNAVKYLEMALQNYHNSSALPYAMALTKSRQGGDAVKIWDSLAVSNNEELNAMARNIRNILSVGSVEEALDLSDSQKYQFLIFSNYRFENEILSSFEDKNFQAQAFLEKALQQYSKENYAEAEKLVEIIKSIDVSENNLKNQILLLEMRLKALRGNTRFILENLENVKMPEGQLNYFKAKVAISRNDTATTEAIFDQWADKNPYNEDLVVLAYQYYESKGDIMKAYDFIQKAASVNIWSIKLKKEYIRHCGRTGNINFGTYALGEARDLLNENDYKSLENEFYLGIEEWNKFSYE